MRALVERVPRLQRLGVFEAAARLGTFTAAAAELGMTQPAVTRHVRALERDLGVALFERSANRALLSDAGRRLQAAVGQGFATIESELERIGAGTGAFVLAANPGIAQRWLVPHLDGLRGALGDIELRLWLFDRDAELARGAFDAAIHAGTGKWPGFACRRLFPEIGLPVATPSLASRLGLSGQTPAAALPAEALLYLDETDRPWMSWTKWFALQGVEHVPRSSRIGFNNYALVLQEAMAGHGIALAWRYLVDDALDRGLLVPVGAEVPVPSSGYYLLWPEGSPREAVDRLARWLDVLIGA